MSLYSGSNCLERRFDYMKKNANKKISVKVISALLVFIFLIISIFVSYVVGCGMAQVNDFLYKHTEHRISEINSSKSLTEMAISAEQVNTYERMGYVTLEGECNIPLLDVDKPVVFEEMVSSGTSCWSNGIVLEEGQVFVMACTAFPCTETYCIGIINSEGDIRYVEDSDSFGHGFQIYESDTYFAFIQNKGQYDIATQGSCYCYTLDKRSVESTQIQ